MNKIKSFAAAGLCFLSASAWAQTNVVYGNLVDLGQAPVKGATVTLSLVAPNPKMVNSVWTSPQFKASVTDASGNFAFRNLDWGQYEADVAGSFITFNVPPGLAGSNDVSTLATNTQYAFFANGRAYGIAAGVGATFTTNGNVVTIGVSSSLSSITNAYPTNAPGVAAVGQVLAVSTNYDALGSAYASTNILAPSAWGNASGLTSGTLPSAQLPSSALQQNQNNDANLNGGLAVRRGLSVLPTTKNDGLEVDIVTPGSVANPIGARDTNNVLRFNVDSNFVAHGDAGGLTNVQAANLTGGPLPVSTLPTVVVTNGSVPGVDLEGQLTLGTSTLGSGQTSFQTNGSWQASRGAIIGDTTGNLTATSISANGAGLTSLNASALASGTMPPGRLPASVVTNLTPFSYGGIGDGIADDTLALQSAINATVTTGVHKVDLRYKTWRISQPILITNLDTEISGGTILTTNQIVALWIQNDRAYLHDLVIGGPSTNFTSASIGILASNSTYIQQPRLEKVKITNFWFDVHFNFTVEAYISGCQFTAQGSNSLRLTSCDQTEFANSSLGMSTPQGADIQDPGHGTGASQTNSIALYMYSGGSAFVHNNDFNWCGSGIYIEGGGVADIVKNNFESMNAVVTPCIVLTNNVSAIIEANIMNNSLFTSSTNFAFGVYNCSGSRIILSGNAGGYVDSFNAFPIVIGHPSYSALDATQTIYVRSSWAGPGVWYGPSIPNTQVGDPFEYNVSFTSGQGANGGGITVGGDPSGHGVKANTQKSFTFTTPDYTDNHPCSWAQLFAWTANELVLYLGGGGFYGCTDVRFYTTTSTAVTGRQVWDLDRNGNLTPSLLSVQNFGGIYLNTTVSNLSATGTITGNGSGLTNLTSLVWTNSGAGYLTTGGFKTAAAAGIVYVTCCVTNSQIVWLTNQTTHDVVIMGNTTGTWTNFDNASLPVNSGDSIAITNVSGGNGLLVTSRFYSIH